MLRAAAREWLADRYPSTGSPSWPTPSRLGPGVLDGADRAGLAGRGARPARARRAGRGGRVRAAAGAVVLLGRAGRRPRSAARPSRPTTLAWADDAATTLRDAASSVACRADDDVDGWRLTGVKRAVPDVGSAEQAVVVARTAGPGRAVPGRPGRARRSRPSAAHRGRHPAAGRAAAGQHAGRAARGARPAAEVLRAARRRTLALLACEAVGVTQRALDLAVEHAEDPHPVRAADRVVPGGVAPTADVYAALALARSLGLPGRVVRLGRRPGRGRGGGDRVRGRGPGRGRRLRGRHPGDGRDRLHLGPPAAPLLQAGAVDRRLRRVPAAHRAELAAMLFAG